MLGAEVVKDPLPPWYLWASKHSVGEVDTIPEPKARNANLDFGLY